MTAASESMGIAHEFAARSGHRIAVACGLLDLRLEAPKSEHAAAAPGLFRAQSSSAGAVWLTPGRHGSLTQLRRGGELSVQPHEHRRGPVVGSESEHHLPAVPDQAARPVDQLLHHGLDAPSLGFVAHRRIRP
jgi:hypothetical protein